jgi:pilus assembly protein TadC
MLLGGPDIVLLCAICGGIFGAYLPLRILDRKEKQRSDEILYYLPLVIEQVSIGVSSSLDIGPCVQRIVQMADERDTHNPVTELLRYAQYYVKSGASFEESLTEVGRLSGSHELKHALMALSQVAKFGGEISRQLQELADAVSAQREARVEEKIKKLELAATAPVALVFFGYLVILLTGFGLQIITAM